MKKEAQEYYRKKIESFSDSEDRVLENPSFDISKVRKIHVSGACGKAMASIVGLFTDSGFSVSGSDASCQPPMSIVLDNLGLKYSDFDENNLKDVDVAVVGNVCRPSNPECVYARENDMPQISGAAAVGEFFIKDKKSIVLAGTHGKTTTTSMMVNVFGDLDKEPAFLVGGVLQKQNTSYSVGGENTDYFIIEGDEYDTAYFDKAPKFLHYKPYISVVTSVEFDHADIYKNLKDYRQAFSFLAKQTREDGKIIIWDGVEDKEELTKDTKAEVLTYGFSDGSDFSIKNLRQESKMQVFDITFSGKLYKDIKINMSGKHNVLNAVSVLAVAILENLDLDRVKKSLQDFSGVKKRQEVLADKNGILVIDDFAHHPTAVATTLDGLSEKYPEKNIIAIFEPRSNTSRMKEFQQKYVEVFSKAKRVIISTPPFRHNDKKEDFIDVQKLVRDLESRNIESENIESADKIFTKVSKQITSGDMVVIMSNGDFGNLAHRFASFVENKYY